MLIAKHTNMWNIDKKEASEINRPSTNDATMNILETVSAKVSYTFICITILRLFRLFLRLQYNYVLTS